MFPGFNMNFKMILDHTLPLALTIIDWTLNSIGAQYTHILTNTFILFLYACVNYVYCKVSKSVIYEGISWDSRTAWIMAGLLFPLAIFI